MNVRPTYTYCNPYCVANVTSVYDYNQPLEAAGEDQQLSEIASNYFAEAREAFYAGDLKTAMEKIELAIKEMPSNSDLHQFRSLVLFSMKQYGQAAASAHVALTAGPGWNWDTLKSLYPSADIYTARLRALEETRDQNKQDPAIRFLLAYHYLMLNHIESAAKGDADVLQWSTLRAFVSSNPRRFGRIVQQSDDMTERYDANKKGRDRCAAGAPFSFIPSQLTRLACC